MCRLLVEGMEAGACGWSAQIAGDVGNVQLDYDGTPMVTDCMTDREVIAFSRAMGSLGRGVTQITGSLETAALMARESGRPIIWNALLADGALNQHGGAEYTAPRRTQAAGLPQRGGGPAGLRPGADRRTSSRSSPSRTTTWSTRSRAGRRPAWARVEEKIGQVRRPRAPARRMKEIHEERGGLFGAGYA